MRDLVLMTMTAHGPVEIRFALTGQTSSRTAYDADVATSRAHSILVAGRTQTILA
jgi:hypothetical protein